MAAPDDVSIGAVPVYHVITPGDHYSPRTGSAIPTVVDGLARGASAAGDADRYPQRVVVQDDTYRPRYASADTVEYSGVLAPGGRARIVDAGFARLGMPRRGTAHYFRPAVESLRGQPPGVVLAHNAPIVPWLLRDQEHTPLLYAHNDVLRSYSRAEASRVLGDRGCIVSVSDSLAAQTRERLPPSLRGRVRTVVNGADTARFTPTPERDAGPLRVMFFGRAIPEKGADILLAAAAIVNRADLEYVVVGSYGFDPAAELSPYERQLRELAGHVAGPVRFEPFVERGLLPALVQRADILVIPSRWPDPCPLTVGEGMAAGLPIVAARSGGIPEMLGDAGILFDPAEPRELADALTRLVDDPNLRIERGDSALARARERDWTWAWRNLAHILDEVGPAGRGV